MYSQLVDKAGYESDHDLQDLSPESQQPQTIKSNFIMYK